MIARLTLVGVNALNYVRNVVATRAQVSQPVLTAKVLSKLTGSSSSSKGSKHGPQFDPQSSAIAQANAVAGALNFPSAAEVDRTDGILAARRAAAPAAPGVPAETRIPFDEEDAGSDVIDEAGA